MSVFEDVKNDGIITRLEADNERLRIEREVQRILALPDVDLRAEIIAEGGDPEEYARTARSAFDRALIEDAVALALLHATCRYYGDPIPEKPDLSLTRVLARAALDAIEQLGATQTKTPPTV
jgi:hypothetical protein